MTTLGLRGVLLKGNYQNKFFDEPFFLPIFEAAATLDVPVYFHPSFIPQAVTSHYFESNQWSDVVTGILSSAGYGWHMDVGIQVIRMIASGILIIAWLETHFRTLGRTSPAIFGTFG